MLDIEEQAKSLVEVTSVAKQVVKENGFRFIQDISRPTYAPEKLCQGALDIVKPQAGSIVRYQLGRPNPYSAAVGGIIKGNVLFGNVL